MQSTATKAEFAALSGVTKGRVSQWLRAGKIDGAALVGEGRRARINIEVARRQLDARLDLSQRLGANGRAKLDGETAGQADPTDAAIKSARLAQLERAVGKARAEEAARSGRYIEADAARQEMGKIAGRVVASFEGGLPELASALAAHFQLPQRDVLHVLRTAWRGLRARLAGEAMAGEAVAAAAPAAAAAE